MRAFLPGALFPMLAIMVFSADVGAQQRVVVSIENLVTRPSDRLGGPYEAPMAFPLWYAFHDGSLDVFDEGALASPELGALASEGLIASLIAKKRAEHPDATVNMITNNHYGPDGPHYETQVQSRAQMIVPERHGYFSFAAKVAPSDDAFIGNDDPNKIRVFDHEGRFLGPIVIDIYGEDVYDAGVRINDEMDVAYLVDRALDISAGTASNEPVGVHPGYNGSVGNPDGAPVGILGVAGEGCDVSRESIFCFHIDPILGDFKRPKYPLARIRITASVDASLNGLWYNRLFAGEGYSFTISGAEPTLAVGAYTYKPDDSGEQLWLFGNAVMNGRSAQVDLFQTEGGRFGSPQNPANVSVERWGYMTVAFFSCEETIVQLYPDSPEYEGFRDDVLIFLERSTPAGTGLERACYTPALNLFPADDSWPNPSDVIEPQP